MTLALVLQRGESKHEISFYYEIIIVFSLTGVCYSSSECAGVSGGFADGRCAQGFGVCCVIRQSGCGGTISQNSTHIQNTGYPAAYTDDTSCVYTFKKSSLDICAIRLDYVEFVTRGPGINTMPYTN